MHCVCSEGVGYIHVPIIFSVVGVNLLVLFLPHVLLESNAVFEHSLTVQAQQTGGEGGGERGEGGEGSGDRERVCVVIPEMKWKLIMDKFKSLTCPISSVGGPETHSQTLHRARYEYSVQTVQQSMKSCIYTSLLYINVYMYSVQSPLRSVWCIAPPPPTKVVWLAHVEAVVLQHVLE